MRRLARLSLILPFCAALAAPLALAAAPAAAQERTLTVQGGQVSAPVGVLVQVRSVRVSPDATVLHLVASFDSHATSFVNLNDSQNAYLEYGEGQRLHLRQVEDNPWLRVVNGETLEGDLVFPGTLPADVKEVVLVLNPGNAPDDTDAPGLRVTLALAS